MKTYLQNVNKLYGFRITLCGSGIALHGFGITLGGSGITLGSFGIKLCHVFF